MYITYARLKDEMLGIAEIVKHFPEPLQGKVFDLMIRGLLSEVGEASDAPITGLVGEEKGEEEIAEEQEAGEAPVYRPARIYGVAKLADDGRVVLTLKDPRGRSKNDTCRRLTYLILRAHELLTGEEWVSFRKVVAPVLKQWNVLTNNTRQSLVHDKGIIRLDEDRDQISLNAAGRMRADTLMEEIKGRKKKPLLTPGETKEEKAALAEVSEEATG